jgi:hypothetical protein
MAELHELHEQVDWSVFTEPVSETCYCRCGGVFRSHTKMVHYGDTLVVVSKEACPVCGTHTNFERVSCDPESFSTG